MGKLPDNLPSSVYDQVTRLEIELYDARMFAFHTNAAILVLAGLVGLWFWHFGRIGPFVYAGDGGILFSSLGLIAIGIVYYVRRDRQESQVAR